MGPKAIALLVVCITTVFIAGCTTHVPVGPGTPAPPVTVSQAIPGTTALVSPVSISECRADTDCVPAECCHPSGCTAVVIKKPCNLMCTASCEGPIDCGAGRCGCVQGTCRVISASSAPAAPVRFTAVTLNASPRLYSPVMSSTPGIGLEPVITGFGADNASFEWKTTYGQFLSWNAPDFRANPLGNTTSNQGEKLYWTFIDKPSSPVTPVTITVTAKDTVSGQVLGTSTVTLAWTDTSSVTVGEVT